MMRRGLAFSVAAAVLLAAAGCTPKPPTSTTAAPATAPACSRESVTVHTAVYSGGSLRLGGTTCLSTGHQLWVLAPTSSGQAFRYRSDEPVASKAGNEKWSATVPWFSDTLTATLVIGDDICADYLAHDGVYTGKAYVIQYDLNLTKGHGCFPQTQSVSIKSVS